MREDFIFGMLERTRNSTLQLAEKCSQEKRDTIPQGFNNSVFWHMGHILTVTDGLAFGPFGEASALPASYRDYFGNGTKPADWTEQPATWESIFTQLKNQPEHIRSILAGKLDAAVKENFIKAETVDELLMLVVLHENTHAGNMNAMIKILNQ